jgi:UDP-N-acetylmuramate dehydrogenase
MTAPAISADLLFSKFGDKLKEKVSLAPFTSARIGGPADFLITASSSDELAQIMTIVWEQRLEYVLIGGGSNILVSDSGVRGLTVLNRAKSVHFETGDQPIAWVESGVTISNLANRCALKGLAGLEWAATVPGTVGGAVYGNAGAFGGDMAGSLIQAEILTEAGRVQMPVNKMGYDYRTSVLKRGELKGIVLLTELRLMNATKEGVTAKIGEFGQLRKDSQPPGASMGSMFKNPAGDHAGRLIEAAGLKGTRIGNAEISPVHANFFLNRGKTKAVDIRALIELVRKTVEAEFGVALELEIELVGDW